MAKARTQGWEAIYDSTAQTALTPLHLHTNIQLNYIAISCTSRICETYATNMANKSSVPIQKGPDSETKQRNHLCYCMMGSAKRHELPRHQMVQL